MPFSLYRSLLLFLLSLCMRSRSGARLAMGEKEQKMQQVTTMVLKVDLQCSRCYKKVRKVLCKFPQIRDQIYDEKANVVIIKVVCCSPENIRDKLCCKGGGCIKTIEIVEPKPPKPDPIPDPKPPKPDPKPPEPCRPPPVRPCPPCPPCRPPVGLCCRECYGGQAGGPCYHGHGGGCGGHGRPVCDCWAVGGGCRSCCVSRCDYFMEENPGCSIM